VAAQSSAPAPQEATPTAQDTRFAVIGDYGVDAPGAAAVAQLVATLDPQYVITVGDNNYPDGEQSTIDGNVGRHYSRWIHPYTGAFPASRGPNRFFPSLGNHDWRTAGAAPYLAYFTLPGNERYYAFRRGPLHFFALDSDPHEPDGIEVGSVQAQWLQAALAASNAPFKLVYFHHPPFSSSDHGSTYALQWPFRAWGADAVIAGHDHAYERLVVDGFPYIVNGLGGNTRYDFGALRTAGSEMRFADEFGAMLVEADAELCTFRFLDVAGIQLDQLSIRPTPVDFPEVVLVDAGSTWRYRDNGSNQGTAWRASGFPDGSWPQDPAQLGFGDGDEATVIDGGPAGDRHVTAYFRKSFSVASPAQFRALRLELVRDDGAAVFLNGQEVLRDNLPAGADWDTLATGAASDENAWRAYDVSPSQLVAGTNVLAVEVHQSSVTSSDTSFDLRLVGYLEGTLLVARGSTWRYRDTGVDPGPAWRAPRYDDSAWPAGPAELGYGDGDEQTVVSFGPDAQAKHVTTWFRRTFQVVSPGTFQGLLLKLERDDGVVVWLNGREAYRWNLPAEPGASTTAGYAVAGANEAALWSTFLDPRLLVAGTNVLAVEVHQSSAQSSDVSFDLELVGL
jgi:hypothetical protein